MKRQDELIRILAGLVLISTVVMCGCRGTRKFAQRNTERQRVVERQMAVESEVTSASFDSICPTGNRNPQGYLNSGPGLVVADGVSSPVTAAARLRQLTTENERLTTENGNIKRRLGDVQNELIETRQALLATQQECQAAKTDLIAACSQLDEWHRKMERTLHDFQYAEQEHIEELDKTIEWVRTEIDQRQKDAGDSAADGASSSKENIVVSG